MNPSQAAREIRRRGVALKRALRRAETASLAEAKAFAVTLSSGPYRPKTLRQMGRPYAKRAPHPPLPPFFINVNSGLLRRSWRSRTGSWNGGSLTSTLYNVAPEATYFDENAYPGGTRAMIARPIQDYIRRKQRPLRLRRLEEAVREVW
jgi:hypothetical protein